jgi:hypothetical protein
MPAGLFHILDVSQPAWCVPWGAEQDLFARIGQRPCRSFRSARRFRAPALTPGSAAVNVR